MKAKTIREKAIEALIVRLEQMSLANGHRFEPTKIYRESLDIPDHPTYPAIYLYEGQESKQPNSGRLLCSLPVLVILLGESHSDQFTTANEMLGDIINVVGSDMELTDAVGRSCSVQLIEATNSIVAGEVNNAIVYVEVEYLLVYYHAHGDATVVC